MKCTSSFGRATKHYFNANNNYIQLYFTWTHFIYRIAQFSFFGIICLSFYLLIWFSLETLVHVLLSTYHTHTLLLYIVTIAIEWSRLSNTYHLSLCIDWWIALAKGKCVIMSITSIINSFVMLFHVICLFCLFILLISTTFFAMHRMYARLYLLWVEIIIMQIHAK